jgi:predicted DNA-binding WGR domain protein
MMQYFEFSEENVSCFWEITLEDRIVRTRYGQKGTDGVIAETIFRDADTATQEYDKLVEEKSFYFKLGDTYRL